MELIMTDFSKILDKAKELEDKNERKPTENQGN